SRPKRSGVERLTAGCRIEGRAVEHDFESIVAAVAGDDRRVEGTKHRVGVVETVSHIRRRSALAIALLARFKNALYPSVRVPNAECRVPEISGSSMPASANPLALRRQL